MSAQIAIHDRLVLSKERSLNSAIEHYSETVARNARIMEAMVRCNNDSHAVEIARIQMHSVKLRIQDSWQKIMDALMEDEERIAAGDQSSVARRDRRHRILKQSLPLLERRNARIHRKLELSEETAEASREYFDRIRRG